MSQAGSATIAPSPSAGFAGPAPRDTAALPGWFSTVAVLVASLAVLASLAQVFVRPIWHDEAWSLYLTEPALTVGELIRQRLVFDVHPPLFNLLGHFLRELLPDRLLSGRLLNILFTLPALLYLLTLWRRDAALRPLLATFLLIFSSGSVISWHAPDFRVYWLLLSVSACYALSYHLFMSGALGNGKVDRADARVLSVSIVALLNLHYVIGMFVLVHLAVGAVVLWRAGRLRLALPQIAATLLAGLLLLTWLLYARSIVSGFTGGALWMPSMSVPAAFAALIRAFVRMAPNLVALLLAAVAVLMMFRPRPAGATASPAEIGRTPALCTLLSLALFVVVILALNLKTPIIIERFFAGLAGPLAVALAALTVDGLRRVKDTQRRLVLLLLVVNSVAASAYFIPRSTFGGMDWYWNDSASQAARLQANCPDRLVRHSQIFRGPEQNHSQAMSRGAAEMAARYNFVTRQVQQGEHIRVSAQCPVAAWLVFVPGGITPSFSIADFLREKAVVLEGAVADDLEVLPSGLLGVITLKQR